MGIQKTEAIVLKTRDFRETSLIINFFTRDFGKLTGLIKGIRNQPQRYAGFPLTFSRNLIVFYERRDLNLVTQCDSQEQYLAIRADFKKTYFANYFVELLDAVSVAFDKNEGLFKLAADALCALCANFENWQVARVFEIKLLDLSGFKPRLEACVNCQKQTDREARFSSILGGILCPRCFGSDRGAKAVLKGTLSSIDYIEKSNWQKALQLKMSGNIRDELAKILNSFLDVHLDKEVKSQKFLNQENRLWR